MCRYHRAMTTEIYICKDGQELKQGKLEYSSDITERASAEEDAKRRCGRDQTIKKIAYYKVAADGDFRMFYSFTNPNCKPAPKMLDAGAPVRKKASPKKPPPPPGLLARIKKSIGL
jgi:hypothetical protein